MRSIERTCIHPEDQGAGLPIPTLLRCILNRDQLGNPNRDSLSRSALWDTPWGHPMYICTRRFCKVHTTGLPCALKVDAHKSLSTHLYANVELNYMQGGVNTPATSGVHNPHLVVLIIRAGELGPPSCDPCCWSGSGSGVVPLALIGRPGASGLRVVPSLCIRSWVVIMHQGSGVIIVHWGHGSSLCITSGVVPLALIGTPARHAK
jgi:hypothetical protein